MILPAIPPIPPELSSWLPLIKPILNFFKKKENQDKVLQSSKPIGTENLPEDLKEIVIFELDNRTYMLEQGQVPPKVFEYIKRQKATQKRKVREIELVKRDYTNCIATGEELWKKKVKMPRHLNDEYYSLFKLSQLSKGAYAEGDTRTGNMIKAQVGLVYGQKGSLFCNLYSQEYLPRALEYFSLLVKADLSEPEKINEFLNFILKYWDAVFFISHSTNIEKVNKSIILALDNSKDYIAIHGIDKLNVKKIDLLYESLIEEQSDKIAKIYQIEQNEGRAPGKKYPKKDIYFFTFEGKLIYEQFQII